MFEELLKKHNLPSSLLDKPFRAYLFLPATSNPNMVTDSFSASLMKRYIDIYKKIESRHESSTVGKLAHL